MSIELEQLTKLEKLAMLTLKHDEHQSMQADFDKIINLINKIDSLKLDCEPLIHPLEITHSGQKDTVIHRNKQRNLLNLCTHYENHYMVPPAIDTDDDQ